MPRLQQRNHYQKFQAAAAVSAFSVSREMGLFGWRNKVRERSKQSQSTLLRSIQCLARFLVTANGYDYGHGYGSSNTLLQFLFCISVWLSLAFFLHFSRVFTPAHPPLIFSRIIFFFHWQQTKFLCYSFWQTGRGVINLVTRIKSAMNRYLKSFCIVILLLLFCLFYKITV